MKTIDQGDGNIKNARVNKQVYDDGLIHVEFESAGYPDKFKVQIKNPYDVTERHFDSLKPDYIDIKGTYNINPDGNKALVKAQNKLNRISKEAGECWKDLTDFFKPYQP